MHVCLLPPEILLHIFSICKDCQSIRPRVTLASLARTCRTFKEPALDILWENIDGFKPLISCLPGGVAVIINTDMGINWTLKRPLLNKEWRIVYQYTQRIHFFRVCPHDLAIVDDRVIQALMSAPSPLLPNLRILNWHDDGERFFPLLRTLLGSTITSVTLMFDSPPPSFAKSALLTFLGARCPSIRALDCAYSGDSEESSDAIFEALCGLQELRRLNTVIPNTQALLCLATLPSLKYLQFSLATYNINETRLNSTPTFSFRLDQVFINTPSPSVSSHCLRNVCFLSCRSAKIFVDYSNLAPGVYTDTIAPYDPLDIPDFIVSFSKCFSPTLEKLEVELGYSFTTPFASEYVVYDPSFVLGFDVVAPLLSFSRLTNLQLDWMCTSAIDDSSLKIMAQSWPQLEYLQFGCEARWMIPPSATFIGLVHLVHHCPRLCRIGMPFSACPVDINGEPFSNTIPNEEITKIDVANSPIVDPITVACQLHMLLPKLTSVDFDWDDTNFWSPLARGEWTRVNDFLQVLTTSVKMKEIMSQNHRSSSA
ncbi:hypothetical protein DFJ58DRAFT_700440 [Suillus subalutaceus]|uniref:uncharacterized protein n=1 Tax=Suillus subalutaceus TaxID=48586 RepID=UPI001B87FD6D|nr:uncharacterized protein DFJ58DRAFT_700440 [Suillus subalutaceus]KAG1862525.1 hypothetical protein DFJ58DRAFT_700440 [Suillus subalutaceus]